MFPVIVLKTFAFFFNRIWEHLVSLAEEEHMTIIITTHYIEEARRAHTVGFLRRGKLLVQDTPDSIINRCGTNTLELAFLRICSREQDANQEAGEDDEDAGAGSVARSSIRSRKKLSFTNSLKASLGVGRSTTNSPPPSLLESKKQSSKEELSLEQQSSSCNVHSGLSTDKTSIDVKENNVEGTQHDVEEGYSHKSHRVHEQTFGVQCNIVKTLASKGVIKMKRSIP